MVKYCKYEDGFCKRGSFCVCPKDKRYIALSDYCAHFKDKETEETRLE